MVNLLFETDEKSDAAAVFDAVAPKYDSIWNSGVIGALQRNQVWREIKSIFRSGEHVLEIGCGTGVDAVHLAKMGVRVHATDVSDRMLSIARERVQREGFGDMVTLEQRAVQDLQEFSNSNTFDGVFSNFGVFNCIRDHHDTSLSMAKMVRQGGKVVICNMNRFCSWEMVWYLSRAKLFRALRRLSAGKEGLIASMHTDHQMRVFYPSARKMKSNYKKYFRLTSLHGIGVFVPPSFMESWVSRKPRFLAKMDLLDQCFRDWPILRVIGDHVLLVFTRTNNVLK